MGRNQTGADMPLDQTPKRLATESSALGGDANMPGLAVLALFFLANALIGTLMEHSYAQSYTGIPVFCCVGLLLSQPVFVAMIATLLPAPTGVRLGLAVFLLAALLWSTTLIPSVEVPQTVKSALLATAPITALLSACPLLLAKLVAGWRLEQIDSPEEFVAAPPASILDMFIFMTFAAIAIALAKPPPDMSIGIIIATAVGYAGAVAVFAIPLIYFMLRCERYLLLWSCTVLAAFVLSYLVVSIDRQLEFWWRIGMGSMIASIFVGIGLPLLVARLGGYRLTTRADHKAIM